MVVHPDADVAHIRIQTFTAVAGGAEVLNDWILRNVVDCLQFSTA